MQCFGCKRSISLFRRVCPYCFYDQHRRAFPALQEQESGTEDGSTEPEIDEVSMFEAGTTAPNSGETDPYEAAISRCKFYIGLQATMIRAGHKESLPPKAQDPFSLGYLFGFVDGWMQAFSVENESLRATARGQVLQHAFNSDPKFYLQQGMSLWHRGETAFSDGMTRGRTDAIQKIRSGVRGGDSYVPATWAQHVSEV
ncbi:MAG: hypothetical protein ABIS23_00120 [Sphingomicrobium sp.]